MKSITATLFLLAFYIRLSGACIFFYSNITNARDFAGMGSIIDEGVRVCTWNGKLGGNTDKYWLSCIDGHYAFVTSDFQTLAYARRNQDFRLSLKFERINTKVEQLYGNEESCYCEGPECSRPKRSIDIEVPELEK
ncbi:hypothetical protein V493_05080 [Pseudogymnoascus sp. VKM F-4281 (FW-2241)]|nr:hypothetical protein V493_05080 [Pseudogymnoascus sp. VKM F-4281 (FW-2241)]